MVMDPWISREHRAEIDEEVSLGISTSSPDILHNHTSSLSRTTSSPPVNNQLDIHQQPSFFEDNFQPPSSDSDKHQPFTKLPDSQQYLESLEKKLARVQTGGKKGTSANSILESLSQTREACMVKLLANSVDDQNTFLDEYLADEVKVNLLLKKIAPERQAISTEELIHLLKADQLELKLSAESEDKTTTCELSQNSLDIESTVPSNTPDNLETQDKKE